MIAKPSIAFNDFAGSAKDVTARSVQGRTILSSKAYHGSVVTPAQALSRNSLSKISRAYKQLSDSQMKTWETLAARLKSKSSLGYSVKLTAHNAFVRINSNRQMAGMPLLAEAPAYKSDIPQVAYSDFWVKEDRLVFIGIEQPSETLRLVLRMGTAQSAGISSGWGNLVIVSPDIIPDWGEVDALELYCDKFGVTPEPGRKYFIEMYWLDTETGFTGQPVSVSAVCGGSSAVKGEEYIARNIVTQDDLDIPDNAESLDYLVEGVDDGTMIWADITYGISGYVSGISGGTDMDGFPFPDGSYYAMGRGLGDREKSVGCVELLLSHGAWQVAGRGGDFDFHGEVFGVTCLTRKS